MSVIRSTVITSVLLAEQATIRGGSRLLMLAVDPALIDVLASDAAQIDVFHPSSTALNQLRTLYQASQFAHVRISDDVFPVCQPPEQATYDAVLMALPKGREFARAWLWCAYQTLKPEGKLYLAGENDDGIRAVLDDAATLFGRNVTLATKGHARVGVSVKAADQRLFPEEWGTDPTELRKQVFSTPQGNFQIATLPGVFSWDRLDDGTRLLLGAAQFAPNQSVLDVGCGNGIIGVAAGHRVKQVTLTDENLLAVRCARESCRLNQLANATVIATDVYDGLTEKFDVVLSNPPFHQDFELDKTVAMRIITQAPRVLNQGGKLILVCNAFLTYAEEMATVFGAVRIVAKNSRFMVLEGTLPKAT